MKERKLNLKKIRISTLTPSQKKLIRGGSIIPTVTNTNGAETPKGCIAFSLIKY